MSTSRVDLLVELQHVHTELTDLIDLARESATIEPPERSAGRSTRWIARPTC